MFAVIGLVVLLVMVFGGFAITGGDLEPVLHAVPHEMMIIGGAASGRIPADRLGPNIGILDDVGALRRLLRARREAGAGREV